MRTTAPVQVEAAATLWRCGGRECAPGECDHDEEELHRHASGSGPQFAPDIVHDVLRTSGQPLPDQVRHEMEARLGHDFADVRIHTDGSAGESARQVEALAYTVGRHVAFAPGQFNPGSEAGRRLIAHELTHAAGSRPGPSLPSGHLRVSSPDDPGERQAVRTAASTDVCTGAGGDGSSLMRQQAAPVQLTGFGVSHERVTVPPEAGLNFAATVTPANATGVALSVVGNNATINALTTVNQTTRRITVAPGQTGGSAHVAAAQSIPSTTPGTGPTTVNATAPFNFCAVPGRIASTASSARNVAGYYGGDFVHTFTSPGGGATALERSHVNEKFPLASGTTLTLNGLGTTLTITVNDPDAAGDGWDLDAAGAMAGPDQVSWENTVDARPFVANASNRTPANRLPQALSARQNFRNLSFPSERYGPAAVASTTHRRALEDRSNLLKAVTSANATGITREVEENYAGPTVFRRCRATPNTIAASAPAPPGGTAPAPNSVTVAVDAEGVAATPTFTVQPPELGCTFGTGGTLNVGTTPGTVTVRAGDASNFDETTVTITAPPTPTPGTPTPGTPTPGTPTPGTPTP